MAVLIAMTARIAIPSTSPPVATEATAAPASRSTGSEPSWSQIISRPDLGCGAGSRLGPDTASRSSASLPESPSAAFSFSARITSAASSVCQAGPSVAGGGPARYPSLTHGPRSGRYVAASRATRRRTSSSSSRAASKSTSTLPVTALARTWWMRSSPPRRSRSWKARAGWRRSSRTCSRARPGTAAERTTTVEVFTTPPSRPCYLGERYGAVTSEAPIRPSTEGPSG